MISATNPPIFSPNSGNKFSQDASQERMRILLALVLLATANVAHADARLTKFLAAAKTHGFVYKLPAGYRPTPVVENRDMQYDFAIRHPTRRIEVRYALRPQSAAHRRDYADFGAGKLSPGSVVLDPNATWRTDLLAVALNLGGGVEPTEPNAFPPAAVAREFGATAGATTSLLRPQSQFGKGWQQIVMFVIHRDDVGEGYVFVLLDDPNDFPTYGPATFHSLQFARPETP